MSRSSLAVGGAVLLWASCAARSEASGAVELRRALLLQRARSAKRMD